MTDYRYEIIVKNDAPMAQAKVYIRRSELDAMRRVCREEWLSTEVIGLTHGEPSFVHVDPSCEPPFAFAIDDGDESLRALKKDLEHIGPPLPVDQDLRAEVERLRRVVGALVKEPHRVAALDLAGARALCDELDRQGWKSTYAADNAVNSISDIVLLHHAVSWARIRGGITEEQENRLKRFITAATTNMKG